MEYCTLKGFLMVLLIQHCTSEGLSTAHRDGQTLPQEQELPPADVVPVVSPPSLKEVQQAVQEASEQVEGRGAEEVLKELLERVVEAALVQAEGGSEAKMDVVPVQEAVEEDVQVAETKGSETETGPEVVEQATEGDNMGIKEEDDSMGEEQAAAEVDAFEDAVEEGKGVVEGEGETAAGSVEGTTVGIETGEVEGEEVINESLGSESSQEVVEGAVVALEETGGDLTVEEEAGEEDSKEQVVLSEETGAAEIETHEAEETPAVVEVAVGGQPEQETVEESEPSLEVADVEHERGIEEALGEQAQLDELEGEAVVQPSHHYEMETTQTVVGEPVQEEEEEDNIVRDAEGPEVEDEQGYSVEGGTAGDTEAEGADVEEITGDESLIKEESVALGNNGGDQKAAEEEQIVSEPSPGGEEENQEVLVISGPEPEDGAAASIEQSPENQTPTPNPSLTEVEDGENTPGDEKSNHGNEIITPTDDLLPHDPAVVLPTLDNIVNEVLAEHPQAEGEEPGEANELVEDTPGTTEANELGLEAWKIGAISAAVFLVLETVVIIIYILKCRNKNSAPALQRACEEGCVEPEAATGGDCSDDTLPAGNGDTQQIAALDPSDVAKKKEQQEDQHAIAMSDLPPSSHPEESANTGPGPDSSQDLRTSIL